VREQLNRYLGTLADLLRAAEVTGRSSKKLPFAVGCEWVRKADAGNKILFIANGGNAGIGNHLPIDFSKNGDMRALAFSDRRQSIWLCVTPCLTVT